MTPTFKKALEALKDEINVKTGLSNTSDRRKAIEMFQWLLDVGESADQDAIVTHLMNESVPDDVALEIQRLYEALSAARRIKGNKWWSD